MKLSLLLELVCLVLFLDQAATECPVQCACSDHNIDCHARSLAQVPKQGISPHATTWDISYNNLTSLQHDSFHIGRHFDNDIAIDLSFNQIVNVSEHAFSQLKNVMIINLSQNNISHIEFSHVRSEKLYALYITHNPHLHLPDHGFQLRHLKVLSMKSCGLSHIPHRFFAHMNRIEILELERNKISSLDPHLFASLNKLVYLDLSGNKFVALPFVSLQNVGPWVHIRLGSNPFVCDCKTQHAYDSYMSHRGHLPLHCTHTDTDLVIHVRYEQFYGDHCSHLSVTDRPEEAVETVVVPECSPVHRNGAVVAGTLFSLLVIVVVVGVAVRARRTLRVRDVTPQRFSILNTSDEV